MKMLILAQNPKIPMNLTEPLKGTKSWKTFSEWITAASIPVEALEIRNAFDKIEWTSSFGSKITRKLIKGGWVEEIIGYPVIVCLGRVSEEAIRRTRELYFPNVTDWDHYFLPHPSGLNRVLNDPEIHLAAIETLKTAHKKLLTLQAYEGKIVL